jgi:hypothetical protein
VLRGDSERTVGDSSVRPGRLICSVWGHHFNSASGDLVAEKFKSVQRQVAFGNTDRLFFVQLYRWFPSILTDLLQRDVTGANFRAPLPLHVIMTGRDG